MPSKSLLLMVLALASCGGAQEVDEPMPLQRQDVVRAFAAADEPLVIRLDLSDADPKAPLEVIFVPEREDVPEPPFELNVFDTVEAADMQAESMEMVAVEGTDFVVWKNIILVLGPSLSDQRRGRLVDTLESL